ncbi:VOC family protein [Lysinibacillus sp. KCTC 33748]|uniref:VOC family protein n=1 Tax=unclassified Lysinibacillus TaxID=2636778 RepID=UPI0009A6FF6B|nr:MULTISPECIES: VOC family protein [unclassified Lysinibacillus]OXS72880.1 VOC family protein [Lysinibacillus sp. KCTC 33748]SKB90226.1 Glyoxalase superfamily enzyme, possibly 3-demethylubiquinone-9 3-methyltransferase [Lysinibacillus sp. AC-3]
MKSATTFLMFQGQANEAIQQYQQWFSELQVESLTYMEDSQQVAMAVLHLKGLKIMVNDSVIQHNFTFTPSTSIFVECESIDEIDSLVAQILEGGQALMPLDNYGFSKKFTWIQDRFGVSWQLTYN